MLFQPGIHSNDTSCTNLISPKAIRDLSRPNISKGDGYHVPEENLSMLIQMGFNPVEASAALVTTGGDILFATNILCGSNKYVCNVAGL